MTTALSENGLAPRTIVVGQFVLVLSLLASVVLLSKFLGSTFDLVLLTLGIPIAAVSALVVAIWALWKPRGTKWRTMLVLYGIASLQAFATPWIGRAGDRLFFETRRAALDAFTREIVSYGRIQQMSDGTRHFKELNHQLVAYAAAEVDTTRRDSTMQRTLPIAEVLARDSVDRKRYEDFRARLQDLKFIEFDVQPDYVAFLYDGFLDNSQGYLVVRPGRNLPALHSELFASELIMLRAIGGQWYWFATT